MNDQTDLEAIFLRSLEFEDSKQRAAFLDEACASDSSLRGEVERLLGSHEVAGSFLEGDSPLIQATELQWVASRNESVLKAMKDVIGVAPAVSLKEDELPEPVQRVGSVEIPVTAGDGRYQLQGEIARGGMGAVIKGRDTDLGRDLAVKVLLESHRTKPDVIQRFVEEAQIGGQLQHPGIAPVYELGQFEDQRPYFTMKLVKGKTLAALLAARKSLEEDRSKFIGIFEQVCQPMAYAHSRGVIHRDLKPANIMVGAFGEVQVMDWGLAKVLRTGGIADETKPTNLPSNQSVIETLRSAGSDTPLNAGSQTQMGSVLGTPAYMPPEQALGEIDQLDERCDVFGLGAILCEILTGHPPYTAEDNVELYRMATRGKVDGCFTRLDECGADEELITIAKQCLSPDAKDRPLNAEMLSEKATAYVEAVESRLRESEIDRATQAARVVEERKRRKQSVLLLSAIAVLVSALGGAGIWLQQQKTQAAEELRANETERAELERRQKETTRGLLYGAQINLAASELRAGQTERARAILDEQAGEDAKDLRGFEWHLLRRQCMDPVETVNLNWKESLPNSGFFEWYFWRTTSADNRIVARCPTDEAGERRRVVLSEVDSQKVIGEYEVGYLGGSDRLGLVPTLVLNADGTRFALRRGRKTLEANGPCNVEIWDAVQGQLIRTIPIEADYRDFRSVEFAFSPDSSQVAVLVGKPGSRPNTYTMDCVDARCDLYDIASGEKVWSVNVGDHKYAQPPVFSPDGKRIALARIANPLKLSESLRESNWVEACTVVLVLDASSGIPVYTKELPPRTRGFAPAFSPDSRKLVFVSADLSLNSPTGSNSKEELLWIWDADSGKTLVCNPIGQTATAFHFSPDGALLAAHNGAGTENAIVSTSDGSLLARIRSDSPGGISKFSADSRFFESVSAEGTLNRWEINRNPFRDGEFHYAEGHEGPGCLSGNGQFFARLDSSIFKLADNEPSKVSIRVYSLDGELIRTISSQSRAPFRWVSQFPMMVLDQTGTRLSMLRLDESMQREQIVTHSIQDQTDPTVHYQLSENQTLILLFGDRDSSLLAATFESEEKSENELRIWNTRSGKEQTLSDPEAWIGDATLSPDGQRLAVEFCDTAEGQGAQVRVYSTPDLKLLATHPTKFDRTFRLRFDTAGRRLAIADAGQKVVLWNIETGVSNVIDTQWDRGATLAFSSDDTRLFAINPGRRGYQLRIWNTNSGAQVFNQFYAGFANAVNLPIAFQSDTQRLIGWPFHGPPHIWDGRPVEATINR